MENYDLDYLLQLVALSFFSVLVIITIPVWIIPYIVYKIIKYYND